MTTPRLLYELQDLDIEWDKRRAALARVEAQLQDDRAVAEATSALEGLRSAVVQKQLLQKERELTVDALRGKLAATEKKLYDGTVTNTKELLAMQEEVRALQQKLQQEEEHLLDVMQNLEDRQQELARKAAEFTSLEANWRASKASLSQEREQLLKEVETLGERRRLFQAQVLPDALKVYEKLRLSKNGQAVVKIEGGMCRGCRITLPVREIQQARANRGLVQCTSCGRILYVS